MVKTTKFELKLRRRNIPSEDIVDDTKLVAQEIGAELIASQIYIAKKDALALTQFLRGAFPLGVVFSRATH